MKEIKLQNNACIKNRIFPAQPRGSSVTDNRYPSLWVIGFQKEPEQLPVSGGVRQQGRPAGKGGGFKWGSSC